MNVLDGGPEGTDELQTPIAFLEAQVLGLGEISPYNSLLWLQMSQQSELGWTKHERDLRGGIFLLLLSREASRTP